MSKLIPFDQLSKIGANKSLSNASVVIDNNGVPVGFFFGRDTFISLMTIIDEQFEQRVTKAKDAYDNFAGKIIDLVEEKLPVSPKFQKELGTSIKEAKKKGWVSLDEVKNALDV